ncbi:LysM peptidoglycan-binding domain-containing protein [Bacillus sp. S/N-304-OC-R1]|uniref:LysM peptidoglycan-binding domain-containing protein n=1 Tax=Bacillus sp. S/N-304-OC-R1 TaxID=2758034 RepID=UPI001C8DA40B|nr:LysM peptidoglycan-binding domain-containing protein [Bacillus sp. S/N-304-OC-R1]MBY0122555.1 LysM peptidoglycan-binding domain-containing protein [Bacillus sp. S/N-304-OC-R1]
MNKEGPYRDQAERLRKKVDRKWEAEQFTNGKEELPPRSRLHREKRKKNKWKVKYPVIRLLALLFILLPITIFTMYNYLQKNSSSGTEKASTQSGYETIGFEEEKSEKGTIIEEREEDVGKSDQTDRDQKEEKDHVTPAPESPVVNHADDKSSVKLDEKVEEEQKDKANESNSEAEVIYHTVKANETMFRIAMKYYNSQAGIDIIKKANGLSSNDIQAGQVLKIPKK